MHSPSEKKNSKNFSTPVVPQEDELHLLLVFGSRAQAAMAHAVETALNSERDEDSAEMEAAEALLSAADELAKTPRAHSADGTPLAALGEGSSSSPVATAAAAPQITATGLAPGATLWAPPRGASLASLFPDWAPLCAMGQNPIAASNGTAPLAGLLSSLPLPPPPACALVSTPVPRVPAPGAPSPAAPGTVVDVATGEPACPTLRVELVPTLSAAAVEPAGALAAGRPPPRDAPAGAPGACPPPPAACVCEVAAASSSSSSSEPGGTPAPTADTEVRLRAGVTSVVAVRGARSWMGPVAGALPLFAAGPSPLASEASSAPATATATTMTTPHWLRPVVAGVGYASTVPEARFYASPTDADVASAAALSRDSSPASPAPALFARAVVVVGRGSPERGASLAALSPGIKGDAARLAAPTTTFAFPACSTPELTFFVGEKPPPREQSLGPIVTPVPTTEAPPLPPLPGPGAPATPAPTAAPEATPEATAAPPATAPPPPPAPVTTPSPPPPPSPQQQPAFCSMRVPLWGQCGGKGGSCGAGRGGRRRGGGGAACEDAAWAGACCGAGSGCQRVNEWWWKCAPGSGGGGGSSASPSSSGGGGGSKGPPGVQPASSPALVKIHKQCGGKAGDGCDKSGGGDGKPACADAPWAPSSASGTGGCEAGSVCRRDNEWYWQCARDESCSSSGSKLSPSGNVVVADWGQCGGSNGCPVGRGRVDSDEDCEGGGLWPGHECCGGGECVAVSGGYFSQCQPPK